MSYLPENQSFMPGLHLVMCTGNVHKTVVDMYQMERSKSAKIRRNIDEVTHEGHHEYHASPVICLLSNRS